MKRWPAPGPTICGSWARRSARRWRPSPDTVSPEPASAFIRRCLFEGEGATRLDQATRDTVWQFVEDNAGLIEEVSEASHLVHADFRKPNILVARRAEGWAVTA